MAAGNFGDCSRDSIPPGYTSPAALLLLLPRIQSFPYPSGSLNSQYPPAPAPPSYHMPPNLAEPRMAAAAPEATPTAGE